MKNLYLLPTNKPSRLSISNSGKLKFGTEIISISKSRHIYITSNEKPKEGDFYINIEEKNLIKNPFYGKLYKANQSINSVGSDYIGNLKKIILTTDQDLIADGVQAIDGNFIGWFLKNPTCDEVEVIERYSDFTRLTHLDYKIIITRQDRTCTKNCSYVCGECEIFLPKQQTIEEAKLRQLFKNRSNCYADADDVIQAMDENCFIETIKQLQAERMYSEEDIIQAFKDGQNNITLNFDGELDIIQEEEEWVDQFKKK